MTICVCVCVCVRVCVHVYVCVRARAYLLLLCGGAAQQHVQQDVGQQVDGDLVVVFDDEAAAGEHLARQLVSHLDDDNSNKAIHNLKQVLGSISDT